MPKEVRLWQVGADQLLSELQRAPLDLEARLQEWLARDISVLDPELLVIGREVVTDFGGYIDILCMDAAGNLVMVELKRDKTPREITAQALDYGSWVVDLSNERVSAIAETHFKDTGFAQAFRNRFGTDIPDTLNSDHRILVVGAHIDESSERIIRYLSDQFGVNINAATFQYFRSPNGAEFLARVFLMEPSSVEMHSRVKGNSKRRPNLTFDELAQLAQAAGVPDLYEHAMSSFGEALQKHTTRSSAVFAGLFDGSRKTVISLLPGESSHAEGLRFQLYKNRFAALIGQADRDVEALMPASHEGWIYFPRAGADYEGFQGFIRSGDEIDRLAKALPGSRPST